MLCLKLPPTDVYFRSVLHWASTMPKADGYRRRMPTSASFRNSQTAEFVAYRAVQYCLIRTRLDVPSHDELQIRDELTDRVVQEEVVPGGR